MYDIGDLKDNPEQLYDMAIRFQQFFETRAEHQTAEIWHVLQKVSNSLWGNLPPVVVIDFRDPDDPSTWGEFEGCPDASFSRHRAPMPPPKIP